MLLPFKVLNGVLDLCEQLSIIRISDFYCGEEILDNGSKQRKIVLQELRYI